MTPRQRLIARAKRHAYQEALKWLTYNSPADAQIALASRVWRLDWKLAHVPPTGSRRGRERVQ